jgi:hypothetical protein
MTFTISGQNAVAILTFCDLALDQVELYVLLAFSTASLSISQAGLMMAGPTTVATQQQFYAAHFSSGQQHLLLDTLILSNQILTPAIQRKVFVETTVSQGKVTQCTINARTEATVEPHATWAELAGPDDMKTLRALWQAIPDPAKGRMKNVPMLLNKARPLVMEGYIAPNQDSIDRLNLVKGHAYKE